MKIQNILYVLILSYSINSFSSTVSKAHNLLIKLDKLYRNESSHAVIVMKIFNTKWKQARELRLETWSKGKDFTLIRILSPKKDKGISTLKRGREMWNYFPKINKQIKIPPSMMMVNWMGSDFTNDDLAKDSSLLEDFTVSNFKENKHYFLTLVPNQNSISLWSKVEVKIDKKNDLPLEQIYYNEKNKAIRTLIFSDIFTFQNKKIPRKLEMKSLVTKGNISSIYYEKLDLNIKIDSSFFSFKKLKEGL